MESRAPSHETSGRMHSDNWDQHWQDYAASAELNPAQRYRRQLIVRLLGSKSPHLGRIMDLGSGSGDLLSELNRITAPAGMLGIEQSATGKQIASQKVPLASFLQLDLMLPVPADCPYREWAGYAVCSEVLEHSDDPGLFLRNSTALMSPGCTLIVTVPGGPMSAFDRHIGHRKHYSVAELRELLEQSGFSVKSVVGAGFPFFNLYRILVILRGHALTQDVSNNSSKIARLISSAMMGLFHALFVFNRSQGKFGWQTVAVAEWTRGTLQVGHELADKNF